MDPHLLLNPNLLFVVALSGFVSLLTNLNVAARPAAVITGRSATSTTIASLFFMVTRFANLFYMPLMGGFVGRAAETGDASQLLQQIRWVIVGSAVGTALSWVLLANFVSVYAFLVDQVYERGMVGALRKPSNWLGTARALLKRAPISARVGQFHGIPRMFLLYNIFATAVWTIGALSALYCSGSMPQYKSTALLLSGLVNSFAAIAFSVFVDPQTALITDRVLDPKKKPEERAPGEQVYAAAVHLAAGNFLGSLLGLVLLPVGIWMIGGATQFVGNQGANAVQSIWVVILLNAVVTMLASTTYAARVSAVITRQVQTALVVYNFFFLITRLSQQVYAPILGAMSDTLKAQGRVDLLEHQYRLVLGGAAAGSLIGLLLLPTFIQVYNKAVTAVQRYHSLSLAILQCLNPRHWGAVLSCVRPPGLLGVRLSDLRKPSMPKAFLFGNVLVLSIYTVGVMSAVFAGAQLDDETSRAATLLSSVVNGLATITLSLVVDPTLAQLTDQCIEDKRDPRDMKVAAVFLMLGMFVGTVSSQILFRPAAWVIAQAAHFVLWIHAVIHQLG